MRSELKSPLEPASIEQRNRQSKERDFESTVKDLESKLDEQIRTILILISEKSALLKKIEELTFKLGAPKPDSS
jgi:hypothetical protein